MVLGMVSHKISLTTIFGHRHFKPKLNFVNKLDIFNKKKIQQAIVNIGSYLNLKT